jgi:4-amino-4-deoxy-L-arabinose transferase-like glycosyltransferase
MTAPANRPRAWLCAILLVSLAITFWYLRAVPPFEGPDEAEHFAYVQWLVAGNGFPPHGSAAWDTPVRQEAGQPPLYYLLTALPGFLLTDISVPAASYTPNPHAFSGILSDLPDNLNRAIPQPDGRPPFAGEWRLFWLARGVTALFALGLVGAVYGLGRTVWPVHPGRALAAAALVAFTPQVVFLGSVVSNDIPAAALATLALWSTARMARHGVTTGRALAIGALVGLAGLTKISALLVGSVPGGWLLWLLVMRRTPAGPLLKGVAALIGGALNTTGWWSGRLWLQYGTPLGLESHDYTPWAIRDSAEITPLLLRWPEIFRSWWIALGWGAIRPPGAVYLLLFLLTGAAVIGLFGHIWRHGTPRSGSLWPFFLLCLGLLVIFLEMWMYRVVAQHGRLLYPAIGIVALLLVRGWEAIHPRLPLLALTPIALLTLLAPPLLMRPAWGLPRLLDSAELAALAGQGRQFDTAAGEPIIELVRGDIQNPRPDPNEPIALTLCWHALAPIARDYTVLIHLIGPGNSVHASRHTLPGNGRYPTTVWRPGEAFCDQLRLLPRTPEQTGTWLVEIGLLDGERDERLAVRGRDGATQGLASLGRVRLIAPPSPIALPHRAAAALTLEQGRVPLRRWEPGKAYQIDLVWSVAEPLSADYQRFLHLRDPATGTILAQADGPPAHGWYPASFWLPHTLIPDATLFALPVATPPGTWQLVTGLYHLEEGDRFGPEFDLGLIEVVP